MRCLRCGHERCVDKRFVPRALLSGVMGYRDCPKYYGPRPIDRTGDGRRKFDWRPIRGKDEKTDAKR